jgi:hypothetical protein
MLPGDGLPAVEEPLLAPALAPAMSVRGLQDVFVFHDPCVLGTHLNLTIRARGQVEAYAAACGALAEIDRLNDVFNWRTRWRRSIASTMCLTGAVRPARFRR